MAPASDEDEDDYLTMAIAEPEPSVETSLQRQRRLRTEREERSQVKTKSKREIAAEEKAAAAAAREKALSTAIDEGSKGFKMLSKLGFKPGDRLGKDGNESARTEPILLDVKEDRGGVGMDKEKKRKFMEDAAVQEAVKEAESRKRQAVEGDYRVRRAKEAEDKRKEGQFIGAMVVAERLDEDKQPVPGTSRPLQSIPVVWRGTVKHRREKERERRMRYDLMQSAARLNPDADSDGEGPMPAFAQEEEELEEDDAALDEFNALEVDERLTSIVKYLREQYMYCFWCKTQYANDAMEGCPGITEEDHD